MWFVAIALLSLLLLTALPLRLDFTFNSASGFDNQVTFTWAGFVRFRTASNSLSRRDANPTEHETHPARPKKQLTRQIPRSLYSRPTMSYVLQCVRRLLSQARIGPTQFALRFGCDNPADTGILFASLVPLQLLLHGTKARVAFEPCFWEECFEPRGQGQLTLVPLRYLAVLGAIALSPRTWRVAFQLIRESKPQ